MSGLSSPVSTVVKSSVRAGLSFLFRFLLCVLIAKNIPKIKRRRTTTTPPNTAPIIIPQAGGFGLSFGGPRNVLININLSFL